jgi:hypothetical protein
LNSRAAFADVLSLGAITIDDFRRKKHSKDYRYYNADKSNTLINGHSLRLSTERLAQLNCAIVD